MFKLFIELEQHHLKFLVTEFMLHGGDGRRKEGREVGEGLPDKTNGKESPSRTAGELGTTDRCFFQIIQSPTKPGNIPQRCTGRVSSGVSHN